MPTVRCLSKLLILKTLRWIERVSQERDGKDTLSIARSRTISRRGKTNQGGEWPYSWVARYKAAVPGLSKRMTTMTIMRSIPGEEGS
jgi:hypothetical protein